MADGDIVNRTGGSITILLRDAATTAGTSNGVWCEVPDGYGMGTVVVTGGATTTVASVNAANDNVQPAAATVGAVVTPGAAATASFTSFPVLPRWIKCAITAAGTGTITAILQARKET
jgi:hypothetical protein